MRLLQQTVFNILIAPKSKELLLGVWYLSRLDTAYDPLNVIFVRHDTHPSNVETRSKLVLVKHEEGAAGENS